MNVHAEVPSRIQQRRDVAATSANMRLGYYARAGAEMAPSTERENCGRLSLLVVLGLAALAAVGGGCAAAAALPLGSLLGSPNASNLNIYHATETRLEQDNFVVLKTNVVGKTSGFSLLGFITIVPADFNKAMGRLYANAGLRPGQSQTVVNMNLYQNSAYFILFGIPRTYVSGDVVEFVPTSVTKNQPLSPPKETRSQTE
jgi:hypothetical protein